MCVVGGWGWGETGKTGSVLQGIVKKEKFSSKKW